MTPIEPEMLKAIRPKHSPTCELLMVCGGARPYNFNVELTDDGWMFPAEKDAKEAQAWWDDVGLKLSKRRVVYRDGDYHEEWDD